MGDCITSDVGPKCPYCGQAHSESEDWEDVFSYHGNEDGPVDYECNECGLVFLVSERVSRSWESLPVVQQKARDLP